MLEKQLLDERSAVMVFLLLERLRAEAGQGASRWGPWIRCLPSRWECRLGIGCGGTGTNGGKEERQYNLGGEAGGEVGAGGIACCSPYSPPPLVLDLPTRVLGPLIALIRSSPPALATSWASSHPLSFLLPYRTLHIGQQHRHAAGLL